MILNIDLDSGVPINQQVYDQIVEAVAAADLTSGQRLPSTRQLALDLGVNFHTVNKAYDRLRQQGFIRLNRKTGAVVVRDRNSTPEAAFVQDWQARVRPLLAEALAHGLPPDDIASTCRQIVHSFSDRGGAPT